MFNEAPRKHTIYLLGAPTEVHCDGKCSKAWGVACRPSKPVNSFDPDDYVILPDQELGLAPLSPPTWEGGFGKPLPGEPMNKWCSRQCERSVLAKPAEAFSLPDFSIPRFNKPQANRASD